jgi:hypothetical protein
MSITGIGARGLPPAVTQQQSVVRQNQPETATTVGVVGGPAGEVDSSLTAQAPAGTDPAVWAVLTSEERTFFARNTALGPVTYNRIMSPKPSVPVGGRIDVRA